MRWLLFPEDDAPAQELGGKARALAALKRAGLPIPDWFVVRPEACLYSLGEAGRQKLTEAPAAAVIQALLAKVLPEEVIVAEIKAGLAKLPASGGFFAVRSSASDEDG